MGSETRDLRREPEPDEKLVRCTRCGRVDLPLNDAELWHYVRTGEGLASECPKHMRGMHNWEYLPDRDPVCETKP